MRFLTMLCSVLCSLLGLVAPAAMPIVAASAPAPAFATVYYIDGVNGNDSTGNGLTSTTAWATLTKFRTAIFDAGTWAPGDEVVISGLVREPAGVTLNFATSYSASATHRLTIRQWLPSDGYPAGGTASIPAIQRAVIRGATVLTGTFSGAGAVKTITISTGVPIGTVVYKYGTSYLPDGRRFGHLVPLASAGSVTGGTNAWNHVSGTGVLTLDTTNASTTVGDYEYTRNDLSALIQVQNALKGGVTIRGITFELAINRSNGAYAASFEQGVDGVIEDCVSYDAGHHAFGITGSSGTRCVIRRCVSMGLYGLDVSSGSTASAGAFSIASAATAGVNVATECVIEDCYGVISGPMGLMISGASSGVKVGNASYGSGQFMALNGSASPGNTDGFRRCVYQRCSFDFKQGAIHPSSAIVSFVNDGSSAPASELDPLSYNIRVSDCIFRDAGTMVSACIVAIDA